MRLQREWAKQYGDQKPVEDYKLFESFFIAVRSQQSLAQSCLLMALQRSSAMICRCHLQY